MFSELLIDLLANEVILTEYYGQDPAFLGNLRRNSAMRLCPKSDNQLQKSTIKYFDFKIIGLRAFVLLIQYGINHNSS